MNPLPDNRRLVQISKLLSLMLRHRPEQFGIALDGEGFAALGEVLCAVQKTIPEATEKDLAAVIETVEPEKRRFSMIDGEIRANYGHSLETRIVHTVGVPPSLLWHGSSASALPEIRRHGLLPMKRQYLHLTTDKALAARIGARHGTPHVIEVAANRAHADGITFFRANESFWLANAIAVKYLRI